MKYYAKVMTIVVMIYDKTTGEGFVYDYCSIGHSLEVYEDAANYFNEAFGGYGVPMDVSTCPFHAETLT